MVLWNMACNEKDEDDENALELNSSSCLGCHSDTSDLGYQIQSARTGWKYSVHANGYMVPIYDKYANINYNSNDPDSSEYMDQVAGYEYHGADTFYANGSGCQVCHTREGFLKDINDEYASDEEKNADVIKNPSQMNCFTCHTPHDKSNFDLTIADGTKIDLESGDSYEKSKGSLCANCHMSRSSDANASALSAASGGIKTYMSYWGPHHGPQADLLLGVGGAEYDGMTYQNSKHTTIDDANCITCHMTYPDGRYSLSPNVGGHSFNAVGIVHGAPKGNVAGCNLAGCHDDSALSSASVGGYGALAADGFLKGGDAYFKTGGNTQPASQMNDALKLLADPDDDCNGLLQEAFQLDSVGGVANAIKWSSDGRCNHDGFRMNVDADDSATATSDNARFFMAFWNYKFIYIEDKSFGVHNSMYALQLLYDSCEDLADLTGNTTADCGTRPAK